MFFSLVSITEWLVHYGYFVLIPLIMIEGPIITVISGSLCSLGIFNFLYVYPIIVSADLAADCLYYAVGRLGGGKFITHWGRYVGIDAKQALRLENYFISHGGKTLLIGKISHGVGGIFLVAAGLAKMSFSKFVWYNFLATLIKSLALLLIGYFFGTAILKINSVLQFLAAISVSLLITALVIYFYYYFTRKNDSS